MGDSQVKCSGGSEGLASCKKKTKVVATRLQQRARCACCDKPPSLHAFPDPLPVSAMYRLLSLAGDGPGI